MGWRGARESRHSIARRRAPRAGQIEAKGFGRGPLRPGRSRQAALSRTAGTTSRLRPASDRNCLGFNDSATMFWHDGCMDEQQLLRQQINEGAEGFCKSRMISTSSRAGSRGCRRRKDLAHTALSIIGRAAPTTIWHGNYDAPHSPRRRRFRHDPPTHDCAASSTRSQMRDPRGRCECGLLVLQGRP
jgi:hypothetical protein